MSERISVVMPCFNARDFVAQAIVSVLDQTYPDVELIVVDDQSTDGSKEILSRFGPRIVLLDQPHGGPYRARNLGLGASTGNYVAFLDADDFWHPECLARLHRALQSTEALLAYCGWQNIGVDGGRGQPYVPPDYELGNKVECFLQGGAPWPIHAALIRREAIFSVGGFDTTLFTSMDYDLWLRVGTAGRIVRVPEVLAFYRHHGSAQITSNRARQALNSRSVKRNFVRRFPERVAQVPRARLNELIDGRLRLQAYEVLWNRDLLAAHRLFRALLWTRAWRLADLRYIFAAMLPESWFVGLVRTVERLAAGRQPVGSREDRP